LTILFFFIYFFSQLAKKGETTMNNQTSEPDEQKSYSEIASAILSLFMPEEVELEGIAVLSSD
jgi:hypothetical protein